MKLSWNPNDVRISAGVATRPRRTGGRYVSRKTAGLFEDAIRRHDLKTVKDMLRRYRDNLVFGEGPSGAPVGWTTFPGASVSLSPLELAAAFKAEDIFIAILERGAHRPHRLMRPKQPDAFGDLDHFSFPAELAGSFLGVKALRACRDVMPNVDLNRALVHAVQKGNFENVAELARLDPKALRDRGPGETSILIDALYQGRSHEIFEFLLDRIPAPSMPFSSLAPIHALVYYLAGVPGDPPWRRPLFDKALKHQEIFLLSGTSVSENTPLHLAASCGMSREAEAIMAFLPEASIRRNRDGQTPLMEAAMWGQDDTVRLILKMSGHRTAMEPNLRGWLPLHAAARSGNVTLAAILVDAYPEALKARTPDARRPVDTATSESMREFLTETMQDLGME
jgi:hypothetical protein